MAAKVNVSVNYLIVLGKQQQACIDKCTLFCNDIWCGILSLPSPPSCKPQKISQ